MSFPDEVVLKAMSNLARPMEVKKENLKDYFPEIEVVVKKLQKITQTKNP